MKNTTPKNILNYLVQELKSKFAEKSEIPSVNDKTITIQLNGTTIQSFTLNQITDETINIQVTKSSVGLGNVGNFYAVSTAESQGLSNLQKKNARDNINATNDEAPDETYNISNHQIQISTSSTPTTVNSFITKLRTLVINVMDDIRTWLNAEIDFNYPALGTDHKFNMGVITQSSISDFSDAVEDALDEVARGFNDHADWVATKADKTEISGSKSVNGNPIAISDAANAYAEEVIANIEPIQDLHGYDHPWVGGAGKNKLPMTVEGIKEANTYGTWSGNTYTYRGVTVEILTDNYNNIIGYDVDGTASGGNLEFRLIPNSPNTYLNKKINGSPASSGYEVGFLISMFDGTTWKGEQFSYNQADSVISINQPNIVISLFVKSGSTASHSKFYPMIRDASVTDSTFEPYSNICPISGLDSVEVKRIGKNLFGGLDFANVLYGASNEHAIDVNEKTIQFNRRNTLEPVVLFNDFKENTEYTLILTGKMNTEGESNNSIYFRDSNGNTLSTAFLNSITKTQIKITAGGNGVSIKDLVLGWYNGSRATLYYDECGLFERDIAVNDFEPYQSETHSTSLPQTVYGGTLNVQTGELVVDRAFVEYDGSSDENWTMPGTTTARAFLMAVTLANSVNYTVASKTPPIIANYMKAISQTDVWGSNNAFVAIDTATTNKLFTGINTITSVEAWKTYLASNPLQVCYELLTPITYHLTPEQVKLFKDYNYIATNADTLDITYQSDNVLGEILGEAEKYTDRVIDDLGTASKKDIETTLANDENLPTGSAVVNYLNSNLNAYCTPFYFPNSNVTQRSFKFSGLGQNESIHLLLFLRYGAYEVRGICGSSDFTSVIVSKLDSGSNNLSVASVSGVYQFALGVGQWTAGFGFFIHPHFPNAKLIIS